MDYPQQMNVPATLMRGGTSKGVFFLLQDLPVPAQVPGEYRDRMLLRVLGSPDPYGQQIDGMGGGSSSTSKAVIISKSEQPDHDVDYEFGQVAIDKPMVDWSGNCGNLTAAVGPFAISNGLMKSDRVPQDGVATVRIWQKNIRKTIVARVPVSGGVVQENGTFELDGVTFPSAPIQIEFLNPVDSSDRLLPTGNLMDDLEVPGAGQIKSTLINAGIPMVFVAAAALGLTGTESQSDINGDSRTLALLETLRRVAALKMGLIETLDQASLRQHTPKIGFIAPPQSYRAAGGKEVNKDSIDLLLRAVSMGKLHHAMMGTAAVAAASAAVIPGTLVNQAAGGNVGDSITIGHPSGTLRVGAEASNIGGQWCISRVLMIRSARVLMEGWVRLS